MHRAFDYNGKRRMSAQIIEGTAARVKLPAGGKCLDVGCGSGALAIAVAKRNPQAQVVGIDRWGKEYASFNKKLCEGNEAEMFVTAWLGYLDLKTGLIRVANAGHNPPVLVRQGKAEYLNLKPGLMLAGMDGVRYKEQTVQLNKGDMLFLYTDGVTEAMNNDEELYGEDRLQNILSFGDKYLENPSDTLIAESVCRTVKDDIDRFTDGAEQSDDITMLCIRYIGGE